MYVLDWGSSTIGPEGLKLVPLTGMLLRIYKEGAQQALYPGGAIGAVPPPQIPEEERLPDVQNIPEYYRMIAGPLGIVIGALVILALGAIFVVRALRR
jgi:hypothetical protein